MSESTQPNSTVAGNGFYISYNDHDIDAYGCDTTALVLGQMEKFYVLKGDYRSQYEPLVCQGMEACISFFKDNIEHAHKFSDKIAVIAAANN